MFNLKIDVLPDAVNIEVQNPNGLMELNENLIVEQFNDGENKWIFAACPLWMCATKETVFIREIRSGETDMIKWNRKLHKNCQKAAPGKYRALIKDRAGNLLSSPVEFLLFK